MRRGKETDTEGRRPCDKIGGDGSAGVFSPGTAGAIHRPPEAKKQGRIALQVSSQFVECCSSSLKKLMQASNKMLLL